MAVAAAIGVGNDDRIGPNQAVPMGNNLAQRLSNKMKMMPNPLGEINRSIEKMSIGTYGNQHCNMPMPAQQTQTMPVSSAPNRRGSNWTNSTEGYGSMRSEQSIMSSRRCSDVSAMSQGSNLSTRINWDPMSADSSRRSSMASNHAGQQASEVTGPNIGQHLNRLHRRAQQHQVMSSMMDVSGRGSAMSTATPTNPPMPPMATQSMQPQGGNVRRASDPVRTLDRNFGVDSTGNLGRHQRSGSFSQLNGQPRVPMHGQRIRGMSGDTYFHGQQPQPQQPNLQVKPNTGKKRFARR